MFPGFPSGLSRADLDRALGDSAARCAALEVAAASRGGDGALEVVSHAIDGVGDPILDPELGEVRLVGTRTEDPPTIRPRQWFRLPPRPAPTWAAVPCRRDGNAAPSLPAARRPHADAGLRHRRADSAAAPRFGVPKTLVSETDVGRPAAAQVCGGLGVSKAVSESTSRYLVVPGVARRRPARSPPIASTP